jgi:hypothetical protein
MIQDDVIIILVPCHRVKSQRREIHRESQCPKFGHSFSNSPFIDLSFIILFTVPGWQGTVW